jgi:type II secretion system protein N
MDSLIVSPESSKIFSGSIPLRSGAIIGGGKMEASLGMPFLGRGYLDAKGSRIRLEELSFLEVLLDRRVSGLCEGELRLLGDLRLPSGLDGRGFLRATDGGVESKLPNAELRMIPFQSISATFIVQKGILSLKDGKITGPAVSGTFSGEVKIEDVVDRSLLRLTASLTPGPGLKENNLVRRFLASLAAPGQPINLYMEGTLGSPSIRWGKD